MKKETIRTIFFTVIIIIGSVWFIRFFIIEPYRITPGQMENSLLPGDRLWVDKWSFRWGNRNPKYRDVLVFELPEIAQTQSGVTEIAIARCIGLPGDTIKSTGNKLFVNHSTNLLSTIIAGAYQCGIRDFDVNTAYEACLKNELDGENRPLGAGKIDTRYFVDLQ